MLINAERIGKGNIIRLVRFYDVATRIGFDEETEEPRSARQCDQFRACDRLPGAKRFLVEETSEFLQRCAAVGGLQKEAIAPARFGVFWPIVANRPRDFDLRAI